MSVDSTGLRHLGNSRQFPAGTPRVVFERRCTDIYDDSAGGSATGLIGKAGWEKVSQEARERMKTASDTPASHWSRQVVTTIFDWFPTLYGQQQASGQGDACVESGKLRFWRRGRPRRQATFTLCCVIDRHPRFLVELILWVLCGTQHLPRDRFPRIVYFVGDAPEDLREWLKGQRVDVRQLHGVLVPGSPHCNKIAPFFQRHATDYTIVCDADLFFVGDPSGFIRSARFRAPPNNHAVPPAHVFQEIFCAAGLNGRYRPGVSVCRGSSGIRETHLNNISAGIVVSPQERSRELATVWRKWAEWLVENRSLLGTFATHVDQVAFALAMEELGEDVELLPPQTNTILHLLDEVATVYAFHLTTGHLPKFPDRFNADRTLKTDGLSEGTAAAVERLNVSIREAIHVIAALPSTKGHVDKFLNPQWKRTD